MTRLTKNELTNSAVEKWYGILAPKIASIVQLIPTVKEFNYYPDRIEFRDGEETIIVQFKNK